MNEKVLLFIEENRGLNRYIKTTLCTNLNNTKEFKSCEVLKLSFCSYVKNELSRINEKENCCLEAELSAIISVNGLSEQEKGEKSVLRITTENAAFARKTYSLFKRIYGICPEVICRKVENLRNILFHTNYS